MITESPSIGTHPRTMELTDAHLPAVSHLFGRDAGAPLQAALDESGGVLTSIRAVNITWWPGSSVSVVYDATVEGGPLSGSQELVAAAGSVPDGASIVERGDIQIGLWRLPDDPALPGLRAALDPTAAADVVRGLGGAVGNVTVTRRAYRPGRRAVVAVDAGDRSLYFKLTRTDHARSLHERHRVLPAALPVPMSLGVDSRLGILVLEAMSGVTLRRALDRPRAPLPHPASVVELAASLPDPVGEEAVSSSIERAPRIAGLLQAIAPQDSYRIESFVERLGTDDEQDRVPSHGDFYESQVLVTDGRISGLLDVDTYGWGRPGDDPATMLGHLAVWARLSRDPERVNGYASRLLQIWDSVLDPGDLRRRVAAVVFGLTTGPFRVQRKDWPAETDARLSLAERWLESARRVDEKDLIATSE